MNESRNNRTDVAVMPMRFSDQLPRMRDFLALLGLSPRVTGAEKWGVMAGASGMVALHATADAPSGAASGETDLTFEVAGADALKARLAAAGLVDSEIYDEAWGRVLTVRDLHQRELYINERPDDYYGYQLDEPQPEHGIVSMPLKYEPPAGTFGETLASLGFVRLDEGDDEWWRVWSGPDGGLVALHSPTADTTPGSVRIGFRTREPLKELAERLVAAGHADVTLSDEYGGELTVTDPDGQKVLVQPVASSV
ncbi:MAG: VOC family protein [Actinopolymorphaceae bacterium]